MKLYRKSFETGSYDFANGFEGMTLGELDANPDDGWYLHNTDTLCSDWNDGKIVITPATVRTGSQAFACGSNDAALARAITAGKTFIVIGYFYIDGDSTGAELAFLQLDDAADHAAYSYIHTGAEKPDNGVQVQLQYEESPASSFIKLYSRFNSTDQLETSEDLGAISADQQIGIKLTFTADAYQLYIDLGDNGNWTLLNQGAWANSGTMGNLDNFMLIASTYWYIDDVSVAVPFAAAKIADLVSGSTHNERDMGGSAYAVTHDVALANIATLSTHLWKAVEIWNNDLDEILWEGWIIKIIVAYNHVTFIMDNGLKVLNNVLADYNGILATGEVTTVGASSIDDINAAFTAGLVGKFCTFTDSAGPTVETDYPTANSNHLQSDKSTALTLNNEWNDHTDLATLGCVSVHYGCGWGGYAAHASGGLMLEFDATNAASTTAWEIRLTLVTGINSFVYDTKPKLFIWKQDTTEWITVETDWAIHGFLGVTYTFKNTDLDDTDPGDYFNGDLLKIFIDWGDTGTTDEMLLVFYAKLVNTYTTVFPTATVYTIDARDTDTLTFTGQSCTGISEGDRYKVGDYLHNTLNSIWDETYIGVGLNYDVSTEIEAVDYTSETIGNILRNFALRDGRRVWCSKGWVIESLASLVDTTIDLTEAHVETDEKLEDWTYTLDGMNIYHKIKVYGSGIIAEDIQTTTYPSPLGIVITDNRLTSQQTADSVVTQTLIDHANEKKHLEFIINTANVTDSHLLAVMKTIDINLYSGKVSITAGEIVSLSYFQTGGGPLYAKILVDGDV